MQHCTLHLAVKYKPCLEVMPFHSQDREMIDSFLDYIDANGNQFSVPVPTKDDIFAISAAKLDIEALNMETAEVGSEKGMDDEDVQSVTSARSTKRQDALAAGPLAPAAVALREATDELSKLASLLNMLSSGSPEGASVRMDRVETTTTVLTEERRTKNIQTEFALKAAQLVRASSILHGGAHTLKNTSERQAVYFTDLVALSLRWRIKAPLHAISFPNELLLNIKPERRIDCKALKANEPLVVDLSYSSGEELTQYLFTTYY